MFIFRLAVLWAAIASIALAGDLASVLIQQLAPIQQPRVSVLLDDHFKTDAPSTKQDDFSDASDFVFFADFVLGAGWSFQVAISNNSPTTYLNGRLGVAVDVNHEQAVSWQEAIESGSFPIFTIPPGGTKIYNEWAKSPDGVIRGGLLLLQLTDFPAFEDDTQMMSAVLTYRNDATGIEVTVPPLGADDLAPPFFSNEVAYSIFVEETRVPGALVSPCGRQQVRERQRRPGRTDGPPREPEQRLDLGGTRGASGD